jgi:hypothetical protein
VLSGTPHPTLFPHWLINYRQPWVELERLRGSGGEALCAPETIASQEQDSQPITPQESVPTAQTASPTELPVTGDKITDEAASLDRTQ